MKHLLVLTDNKELLMRFKQLKEHLDYIYHYAYSYNNESFDDQFKTVERLRSVNVYDDVDYLIHEFDVIISLHCKQVFPSKLVNNVHCINVHPGLNPYNRGWFPQVFSLINGAPCGATIHEIDEQLDHGMIICQQEVLVEPWDTSLTVYNKVLDVEMELLEQNLENILDGEYFKWLPEEGNLNLKKDFDDLCQLDLNNVDTFQNHINKLRALTHGDFDNAFFLTTRGEKIYLKLNIKKANNVLFNS
jgi:dTDP-4-amino-4,6-dideoxyglucose formyltransferase